MGRKLHYKPGSFYRVDDRTGFPQRAERTKREWTGLIVDENVWEPRQPQDLVKGVKDVQSVPDARPLAPDVFVGPVSVETIANAVIGQTSIPVFTVTGFFFGAVVGCMLDNGSVFFTLIALPPSGNTVVLLAGLPYTMAAGNLITLYRPGAYDPSIPSASRINDLVEGDSRMVIDPGIPLITDYRIVD